MVSQVSLVINKAALNSKLNISLYQAISPLMSMYESHFPIRLLGIIQCADMAVAKVLVGERMLWRSTKP